MSTSAFGVSVADAAVGSRQNAAIRPRTVRMLFMGIPRFVGGSFGVEAEADLQAFLPGRLHRLVHQHASFGT